MKHVWLCNDRVPKGGPMLYAIWLFCGFAIYAITKNLALL